MALLLGLESASEVTDYWGGDAAIAWRTSAAEVGNRRFIMYAAKYHY